LYLQNNLWVFFHNSGYLLKHQGLVHLWSLYDGYY